MFIFYIRRINVSAINKFRKKLIIFGWEIVKIQTILKKSSEK